jgi:hypothetical protein
MNQKIHMLHDRRPASLPRCQPAWMKATLRWTLLSLLGLITLSNPHLSSDEPSHLSENLSPIVAYTGDQSITQADVDFTLGRHPSSSGESQQVESNSIPTLSAPLPALPATTQNMAIELVAWQRQALTTLKSHEMSATKEEIDQALRAATPASQSDWKLEQILDSFYQHHGVEPYKFRDLTDFRISWRRYLTRHLTEENLVKHFKKEQARFDGSRFNVDWLVIDVPVGCSAARDSAHQRLRELRNQLLNSTVDWNAFDERDRAFDGITVSRNRWVQGTGELSPALISPLLKLDRRQVSQPIDDTQGVYLLRLNEVEPGNWELTEVRAAVRAHMLLVLLQYLAQQSENQLPLTLAHPR